MKAIVYRRYGGPEVLEHRDVERPTAGEGQALVRVRATSINAADYRMMRADPWLIRLFNGLRRPKRQVLGIDVAGVVEAVGPGVTRVAPGDAIFANAFPDGMGAFAEYVALHEDGLVATPPSLSFEEAAAVPLAGITALQAVRDRAGVEPGKQVLIQGAGGGVGTMAVQIAKALGAHVTAVCGPGSQALVASLGADVVIDYTQEDFAQREERYDAILGINGHRSLGTYKRCLKPEGTYVMVGGGSKQLFAALLMGRLRFAFSGRRCTTLTIDDAKRGDDLRQFAAWIEDGRLVPTIDRTYPLAEIAEAIRYVERGHVKGKVVLSVSEA